MTGGSLTVWGWAITMHDVAVRMVGCIMKIWTCMSRFLSWSHRGGRESTNIKVHMFTSCGHKHQHVIVWTILSGEIWCDLLLQYLLSPHNVSKDIVAVKYNEAPTMQCY